MVLVSWVRWLIYWHLGKSILITRIGNRARFMNDRLLNRFTYAERLIHWVVGVASSEVPWIGTIKLATSGTSGSVTAKSWYSLTFTILAILLSPIAVETVSAWNSGNDEEE